MTPDAIAPLVLLAAGLLVLAGAAKVIRPRATGQALLDAGLPGSDALGRVVGGVEIAAGVVALILPAGTLVLAAAYGVFAGFLGHVLRMRPDAGSCGCAGAKAVPPSRLHLALNVVAATGGLAYVLSGAPVPLAWLAGLGAVGAVAVAAGLGLAGWLAVVAVAEAPAAWRAWVPPVHRDDEHHHHDEHGRTDESLALAGIGPGHPSLWPGVDPEAVA
ncbi:MAG: MauE/DoxX family redox-associated membrane protein [Planctomycetaceae bacterium]